MRCGTVRETAHGIPVIQKRMNFLPYLVLSRLQHAGRDCSTSTSHVCHWQQLQQPGAGRGDDRCIYAGLASCQKAFWWWWCCCCSIHRCGTI